MSSEPLQIQTGDGDLTVLTAEGRVLWRYCYQPDVPAGEAPRPFAHPIRSLAGDMLTNFRPNDHAWHHGLSLTLGSVGGVNFWGGPSYRSGEGYRWRDDHGAQVHRGWRRREAGQLEEDVDWIIPASERVLLRERRTLETALVSGGWSLRWRSELFTPRRGSPARITPACSSAGRATCLISMGIRRSESARKAISPGRRRCTATTLHGWSGPASTTDRSGARASASRA
jgi:hypothetical protein